MKRSIQMMFVLLLGAALVIGGVPMVYAEEEDAIAKEEDAVAGEKEAVAEGEEEDVEVEPITNIEGTKQLCQKAADAFGAGNPKESFQILKAHWPLPSEEIDNMAYQTETQLKMLSARFGKSLGSDFVNTKIAGSSFVQHTYIGKFEKHAVRYVCVFYKPENEWVVNVVYWDDQTPALFN